MRTSLAAAATCLAWLAAPSQPLSAQVITEDLKIVGTQGSAADLFGTSVALSSTQAIVGARQDDPKGFRSGSAYIFDINTGAKQFKLFPADGAAEDFFGSSVDIDGAVAVVGAWADDDGGSRTGSVYLFSALTGAQTHKLVAADRAVDDFLGLSVAIEGNLVIAGAYGNDDAGSSSGSAYLFDATTGAQTFKLLPTDAAAGDLFGEKVGISAGRAIVGAFRNDDNGVDSGSAYIFDTGTGAQLLKLLPADGAANDFFGSDVALGGNFAVVGASGDADNGASSGSAYVFNATTGAQVFKLLAPDGVANDSFGSSVSISPNGQIAVVGASGADPNGTFSGAAYIYELTTGSLVAKITPRDNAALDGFATDVAVNNATVIGGTTGDDDNGANSGSASMFESFTGLQYAGKILPDGGTPGDRTAGTVAIDGSTAVISAMSATINGVKSGAAYVVDMNTGGHTAQLVPNDGLPGDIFGEATAINAGRVVVGAVNRLVSSPPVEYGAAYMFDAATGQQIHRFFPSDPARASLFGTSVDIDGNLVVVGASGASPLGLPPNTGAAFVFNATTGAQIMQLTAFDAASDDLFGFAVGISGNRIVVGAIAEDGFATDAGSAYIFDATTGGFLFKLLPITGGSSLFFGYSVAIDGSTVVVGAPTLFGGGAAYLFDANTGARTYVLKPPPGSDVENFGISVAISGSTVVVGADNDEENGNFAGAAYLFDAQTGQLITKLLASDGGDDEFLGYSVGISGDRCVVGAPGRFGSTTKDGAAYAFTVPAAPPCPGDFNNNGEVDVLDFLDFFDAFGQCDGQPAPCPDESVNADFNGDTFVDVLDFLDFFDAFGQGACP